METENKKIWLIGIAVIVAVVFGMWIFSPTEVMVAGVGTVSVPATSATFNVTVTSSNDAANVALTDLRSKVSNIKKVLGDINIGSDNITETQVTITPSAAIVPNAKGYQAMETLTVKTGNVPMAAEMVVNMYASGATIVSQPVVTVENQEKLEKEALSKALTKAKQSLSDTIGFRPIHKIIGIQQASSGNTATVTKATTDNSTFEVTKAVSVIYRVW